MPPPVVLAQVPSLSDPRTRYAVTLRGMDLACDCQAFASWKKRGLPCWHLRVFTAARNALQRCAALGHEPQEAMDRTWRYLCEACLLALLAGMAAKVKNEYLDKGSVKAAAQAAKGAAAERTRKRKERAAAKKKAKKEAARGEVLPASEG